MNEVAVATPEEKTGGNCPRGRRETTVAVAAPAEVTFGKNFRTMTAKFAAAAVAVPADVVRKRIGNGTLKTTPPTPAEVLAGRAIRKRVAVAVATPAEDLLKGAKGTLAIAVATPLEMVLKPLKALALVVAAPAEVEGGRRARRTPFAVDSPFTVAAGSPMRSRRTVLVPTPVEVFRQGVSGTRAFVVATPADDTDGIVCRKAKADAVPAPAEVDAGKTLVVLEGANGAMGKPRSQYLCVAVDTDRVAVLNGSRGLPSSQKTCAPVLTDGMAHLVLSSTERACAVDDLGSTVGAVWGS